MAFYYQQIDNQKKLLMGIKAVLPKDLADKTQHCVIQEKKLLIYTDSAIWASQLRFYEQIVLSAINQLSRTRILSVQTKILTTPTYYKTLNIRKPTLPSVENITSLQKDSLGIEDLQLRNSLQKLGKTLKKLARN